MSDEDLKKELEQLRRENEELKAQAATGVRLQVSQKGAVSLYGLRRFPITFYKDEWLRILKMADQIRAFIVENESQLAKPRKGE